jgi:amidophosphoribosyltransferase
MDDLYYGTDYQSHLGTEYGGLAVQNGTLHRSIHRIAHGQFKNLFNDFYHRRKARIGVGVISDSQSQPIVVEGRFGICTIVTSGLITNRSELADELIQDGITFSEIENGAVNQTELAAKMIAQGSNIVKGIERLFDNIGGSLSLLLMNNDGIYAACDYAGRIPLTVGEKDGSIAVASETCAFPNLGFKIKKHLGAGEIVHCTESGVKTLREANQNENGVCAFLWIYTGYPASTYEGIGVETVRERCGQALARKDNIEPDLVAGVPDSGTGHAVGYAMESKKPYRRPLVKYSPGYGRSYIPPSQEVRDRIARMKLIPIKQIIEGKSLVVCEDSIVRGTQLKNLTIKKLWEAGAKEVHIRVACPPLMFPCHYSLSTKTTHELAARRAIKALEGRDPRDVTPYLDPSSQKYHDMIEWIREDLNCTSLSYLTLDEMVEAIGLPSSKLCTHCWNGCGK